MTTVLDADTLKMIDLYIEVIYPESKKIGNALAESGLRKTQIRGLETLITSTSRFSEIINYIKNQAGKDKKGQWLRVAYEMLSQLEKLENKAKEIGNDDPLKTLPIKLRLARGWVKQVVSHYLFASIKKEK